MSEACVIRLNNILDQLKSPPEDIISNENSQLLASFVQKCLNEAQPINMYEKHAKKLIRSFRVCKSIVRRQPYYIFWCNARVLESYINKLLNKFISHKRLLIRWHMDEFIVGIKYKTQLPCISFDQ